MHESKKENPERGHESFEGGLGRCLVDGDPHAASPARRDRRKAFGASLAIESLLLTLLVAAPLLTSVAQPQIRQILPQQYAFFGKWHEHTRVQQVVPLAPAHPPAIANPFGPMRPVQVNNRSDVDEGRTNDTAPDFPGGPYVPGAVEVTGDARISTPIEPPHPVPTPQPEKRPVKVSGGVMQAQLISRIEPRYPAIAVQTRQSGTVVLHAIISRDGRIEALQVVSGSPFLVQAALDAVRQWRYRPTMLGGEPVEVETTITVEFRLQN